MEGWKKKKSHLIRYMKEVSKKDHRCYFIKYILCEIIGCAALVRTIIEHQQRSDNTLTGTQHVHHALGLQRLLG